MAKAANEKEQRRWSENGVEATSTVGRNGAHQMRRRRRQRRWSENGVEATSTVGRNGAHQMRRGRGAGPADPAPAGGADGESSQ